MVGQFWNSRFETEYEPMDFTNLCIILYYYGINGIN